MHIVEFFGRLFLSALFLIEGLGKISIQEDVIMYMEDYGVPGILFLPALALEILFPLLLIIGYKIANFLISRLKPPLFSFQKN